MGRDADTSDGSGTSSEDGDVDVEDENLLREGSLNRSEDPPGSSPAESEKD